MFIFGKNGCPSFRKFKRQASFFLEEMIERAKSALSDYSPTLIEQLTHKATKGYKLSPPDETTMRRISGAAYEAVDYWIIVDILRRRLSKFKRKKWRASYKALVVLDHLINYGPPRAANEFQSDIHVIKKMRSFEYIDEDGVDWGLRVREQAERILMLLEDETFRMEERVRARVLRFGTFPTSLDECLTINSTSKMEDEISVITESDLFGSEENPSSEESSAGMIRELKEDQYFDCDFDDHHQYQDKGLLGPKEKFSSEEAVVSSMKLRDQCFEWEYDEHPFSKDFERQTHTPLLVSI